VLIATTNQLVALNPADGSRLSTQPLPAPPVNWGLAIDRHGQVLVTLENGQVLAFGRAATVAALLPTPAP
jgi:ABC-type uncharacterized transport system permease subunit